jgi:hypothetical protein
LGGSSRGTRVPRMWLVELQLERFDYRHPECNIGGKGLAEFFGI